MTVLGYRIPLALQPSASTPGWRLGLEFVRGDKPASSTTAPTGFADTAFGSAHATLVAQGIHAGGMDALSVGGSTAIWNVAQGASGNGWSSSNVGTGSYVWNYNQQVVAGALAPTNGYGEASVWLYTRYLRPGGMHTQSFGMQWASHYLRYLTAIGAGDRTARGTPWVSHSPRTLEPQGIDAMKVLESHVVGGTRFLGPVGTEMTQWGTRIVPEGQVAYPLGFAGEVGAPDVQLYTRYLQAKQFEANPDDLRFGRQDVWNLRQIVQQDYDPNDGLNPPPFGQWTAIENRNKEPVPVGWLSERHGYQFVWNKAVPILPGGVQPPSDALAYKAGSVTHWQRNIYPGGVDSFASERWHATFNKAAPLRAQGALHQDFGHPALENRSRLYDKVGNFDTLAMGTPMVADRIRELTFESRYSIEPPPLPLPEVKLHTRYVEYVSAGDRLGAGAPVLEIRWTYIAPKWGFHPPAWIGEPALRNVTPELRTGGMNHEEFGQANIRTQWRRVETKDGDMTQWGRPIVRDRRHWVEFVTVGAPPNLMPGPKVTKVGGLPDPQGVQPQGIGPSTEQVARPVVGALMARVAGFDALRFGAQVVTANSIRVEPGYWELLVGEPSFTLKNRSLSVGGIKPVTDVGRPRLSPFTIYSVMEAPAQAVVNHPTQETLHYVDHDKYTGRPLTGPGTPRISHWGIKVGVEGGDVPYRQVSEPAVENLRRYVGAAGFLSMRFGVPSVPGKQTANVYDPPDGQAFGLHEVSRPPYVGPQHSVAVGIAPPATPAPTVEFKDRVRTMAGWESLAMGASVQGDTPYQWQGLRVGPLVPNIPVGFDAQAHGTPWVSLRVRDVAMQGFDAFESTYDLAHFDLRMRVRGTPVPPPPAQVLGAVGIDPASAGTPDLRAGRHYIRPDGNAEQYRKGAPQ